MDNLTGQDIKKEADDIYANCLYVADLPKETTNDDLQRIFKDYHFQFATLNNFKNNSTWAQAYFENKEWATKARHELNGYILKPMNCESVTKGKPIRLCKYEGKGANKQTNIKQSLLVKNIDINMTQKEFYDEFLKFGDIVSGKIEYDENGISKGFGYIYYYTEESAEEAKKNLNGKSFFGKPMEIVNLIPGKKNKSNTITLFVLNVPSHITEEELSPIFEQFGPVSNIFISPRNFAYVSYNNFDSASQCLRQMKNNPYSFPGFPELVVKFASSKEERASNRNFLNTNADKNDFNNSNLNIQFNYLFVNPEIKTDLDLDKEIRLFIKVVMLMDYVPKEVLVDLDSMSGLVLFGNYQDYNLFLKKYNEFCAMQMPYFECLPYDMPIMVDEQNNYNDNYFTPQNNKNYMFNQNQTPNNQLQFNQGQNNFRMMNNMQRRNNAFPNMNMGMIGNNIQNMNPNNFNNMNMRMPMNMGFNYMNNPMQRNNKFMNNNNYNNNNNINMLFKNNNGTPYNKNNKFNNGKQNQNNNNNNKTKKIIQRYNMPNNNQKLVFSQYYGNSYNININMNPNMMAMNPLIQSQMIRQQFNPMKFPNNNNFMNVNQNNNNNNNNFPEKNNFFNETNDKQKNDPEFIDQRNLQNLNPSQLQSQFNKPPINLYGPNMLNSKEQEDLINEIADSIYEIVYAKYPHEAAKITGMIKEKGYEKMNMLLSKQEDLNEIIDKAYEMIIDNKNNNEDSSGNK